MVLELQAITDNRDDVAHIENSILKILYFTFTRVLKRRAEITGFFADWISEEPTRTPKNPYAPLFKPMVVKPWGVSVPECYTLILLIISLL